MLTHITAFNEFISERETTPPAPLSAASASIGTQITLFDSIILAKRNRGRLRPSIPSSISSRNPFASSSRPSSPLASRTSQEDFLSSASEHLWRTASASYYHPSASSISNITTPALTPSSTASSSLSSMDSNLANTQLTYREIITRIPAKLDPGYMPSPRMIQGIPNHPKLANGTSSNSQVPGSGAGGAGGGGAGTGTGSGGLGRKPLPKAMEKTLRERMNGLKLNPPPGSQPASGSK